MTDLELPDALRDDLRSAWHRYIDLTAPLRPALHGYCWRLTGNIWDAEDLVQDTLMKGFATLGCTFRRIDNPRAYLLRTASNCWIDAVRRRGVEAEASRDAVGDEPAAGPDAAAGMRDAGARLLQWLSPQERAAVVLKELFDYPLDDIAALLGTSVGAVKAALHRGRERLREPTPALVRRPVPSPALVNRFIDAYRAADVPALLALMLDGGAVENIGGGVHVGRAELSRPDSFFFKLVGGHPEWPKEFAYESARLERRDFDGEPVALAFCTRRGREALEQIFRFEESDGAIARLRGYAFCPETMRAAGEALGLKVRTGLYRPPTPAPGAQWEDPPSQ